MNNKKLLLVTAVVLVCGIGLYAFVAKRNNDAQVAVAKEVNKAMGTMMMDMAQAKIADVKGVPPDGHWHQQIAFNNRNNESVKYQVLNGQLIRSGHDQRIVAQNIDFVNLRRLPSDQSMMEIQVRANNGFSLTSNSRVRLQE